MKVNHPRHVFNVMKKISREKDKSLLKLTPKELVDKIHKLYGNQRSKNVKNKRNI